jgi:biopolymer transport protein ExbD
MKIRNRQEPIKIEQQMVPMIDIIFQLMIFFMLTLKITAAEGDFNINMPIGMSSSSTPPDVNIQPIKVRLQADKTTGQLTMLQVGGARLGNGPDAFERLNSEILTQIGRPGDALSKDMEVEIDADYELQYQYVIRAVGACTGRMDPKTKKIQRYIEKIKFTPPKIPT